MTTQSFAATSIPDFGLRIETLGLTHQGLFLISWTRHSEKEGREIQSRERIGVRKLPQLKRDPFPVRVHHRSPGPFRESEKSTGFLKQFMLRFEVVFCLFGFWFCFLYRVSCIQVWSPTYCVTEVDLAFMICLPLLPEVWDYSCITTSQIVYGAQAQGFVHGQAVC